MFAHVLLPFSMWVLTHTTWCILHYLCRQLGGFTWGMGCFTISDICNVWLMSKWVNPPWHSWMHCAAFRLNDEVTPLSPRLTDTFRFASYQLRADLVCWLHFCSLIAFAPQLHKQDFRVAEPPSTSSLECQLIAHYKSLHFMFSKCKLKFKWKT